MIIDLCSDEEENQSETVNRNHKEVVPLIIDAIEERSLPLPPLEPINQNRSHAHHTALLNLSQDDNDDDLPHDLLFDDNHHSLGIQNKPQKIRKRKVTNEEAKTVRINNKVQLQQRYGYYKYQELSLIIEKSLYDSNLGGELGSYLLFSSENRAYGYDSMTSSISGLCQWTYRNYLDGGNGQLGEVGVVPLPVVMIVYPPQKLISFALQSEDGLTFSEYSQEIQTIRSILSPLYPNQQIKILITLIGIHDECVIYQRTHRNTSNGTTNGTILLAQRIDEILTYSFYIENVEICCRKNSAEFCTYMESLTRVLGEQLYSLEKSSLDTFKRYGVLLEFDY